MAKMESILRNRRNTTFNDLGGDGEVGIALRPCDVCGGAEAGIASSSNQKVIEPRLMRALL